MLTSALLLMTPINESEAAVVILSSPFVHHSLSVIIVFSYTSFTMYLRESQKRWNLPLLQNQLIFILGYAVEFRLWRAGNPVTADGLRITGVPLVIGIGIAFIVNITLWPRSNQR